jgi:hypothetical protein
MLEKKALLQQSFLPSFCRAQRGCELAALQLGRPPRDDRLPLHRQAEIYGREGVTLETYAGT